MCPYNAITCLLKHTSWSSNSSLFAISRSHGPVPLTDSVARVNIANYMAGIRAQFIIHNLDTTPFRHEQIPLFSKAFYQKHSISKKLQISPPLKFHDFRHSGATWAFHNGVPLHHIMHHGTWKSDSVWKYIKSIPQLSSPVSSTFQRLLHS